MKGLTHSVLFKPYGIWDPDKRGRGPYSETVSKLNFYPSVNLTYKTSGRFLITAPCRSKLALSYN